MTIQYSHPIQAKHLKITVFDPSSSTIEAATIQVQRLGSSTLLVDAKADGKGQFRLPQLEPGVYWLGISSSGFQLDVWELHIVRFGLTKELKPKLSVGV